LNQIESIVPPPVVGVVDLASWIWLLPATCALIFPEASPPLKATVLDLSVQCPTQLVLAIRIFLLLLISSVPLADQLRGHGFSFHACGCALVDFLVSARRGLSRPIFILSRLFQSGQGSSAGTKQSSGF
jgi:hypothetical protein